jgi:hypothetical protein
MNMALTNTLYQCVDWMHVVHVEKLPTTNLKSNNMIKMQLMWIKNPAVSSKMTTVQET